MGPLDQFLKDLFEKETPACTHNAFAFAVPPQTKTPAIEADGVFFLRLKERLPSLPSPWCLATTDEVISEFKMQKDHLDREELEKALLRRQAWQRQRAKSSPRDKTQVALWIAAGYLPDWLRTERLVHVPAPGCYRLEPVFYEVYWIASNELPLRLDLLPFLVTRTGRALVELLLWLLDKKPDLSKEMAELLPMSGPQFEEVLDAIHEPEERERLRRRRAYIEALAEASGAKEEFLAQGKREGEASTLLHLLERRLARPLSLEEHEAFELKLAKEGPTLLGDRLLELDKEALQAWLKDPNAS